MLLKLDLVLWFCIGMLMVNVMSHANMDEEMEQSARSQGIDPINFRKGQADMVFKPPMLTEEEQHSRFMPTAYRCDGCKAVAHQFEAVYFPKAEKKKKKGESLTESEIMEVTEQLCSQGFDEYGLKNLGGNAKAMSGPGLWGDKEAGMMEGGGKWQNRLLRQCKEILDAFEEEEIYRLYQEKGDKKLSSFLCQAYCDISPRIVDEL